MIRLIKPENNSNVQLLKEKHLDYIKNPQSFPTTKIDRINLMETQEDQSFPEPLQFVFEPALDGESVLIRENGAQTVYPALQGQAHIT